MKLEAFLEQHDVTLGIAFERGGFVANIIAVLQSRDHPLDVVWSSIHNEEPQPTIEDAIAVLRRHFEEVGERFWWMELQTSLAGVIHDQLDRPRLWDSHEVLTAVRLAQLLTMQERAEHQEFLQEQLHQQFPGHDDLVRRVLDTYREHLNA